MCKNERCETSILRQDEFSFASAVTDVLREQPDFVGLGGAIGLGSSWICSGAAIGILQKFMRGSRIVRGTGDLL